MYTKERLVHFQWSGGKVHCQRCFTQVILKDASQASIHHVISRQFLIVWLPRKGQQQRLVIIYKVWLFTRWCRGPLPGGILRTPELIFADTHFWKGFCARESRLLLFRLDSVHSSSNCLYCKCWEWKLGSVFSFSITHSATVTSEVTWT